MSLILFSVFSINCFIIDLVNLYGATKTLHRKYGAFEVPSSWMYLFSTFVASLVSRYLTVT